ncbi:LuxR C-terminal-related transcriptional regulator [Nocardia huaxiensis]|uniref:Response regulator transcription factor n=1 Tax=Nocardia huaxiensis TaxID=2755382 RepID=A0A7D6VBZ2_9NOCA|nr:response regulator transcription factor [Nocardia huaxiensis]QLY28635.1 response regulator transcription factor [Nocardia huaxiensis]UFS97894.1 response regulator transcription factor [Nocardia huaxiensis]
MPTPTANRPLLLRLVSTLVLALSATVLSAGTAHATPPSSGRTATLGPAPTAKSEIAPANSTISVLIANAHTVFRAGLRSVIDTQPDLSCLAEVGDGPAAIQELRRLRPHIAILDLDMPGLADPAVIDTVADLAPTTRILTLATERSDENLYRALTLGATAFLPKTLPAHDFLAAIRTAAHREALIDPHHTRRLITRLSHGTNPFPAAPELSTLTPREHEVLLLVANAHTNPEIAEILGVGEQTIKTHVSHILAKLGVRDRVQAVVYAHTHRIVPTG